MSINVRSIVTQAYQMAKIISSDFADSVSGTQATQAVQTLNQIVAQLNTDQIFPFTRVVVNYPVVTPKMSYTIGIDTENAVPLVADIVAERPEFVQRLFYKVNPTSAPCDITQVDYNDIIGMQVNAYSVGMPSAYAVDGGYPLMNILLNMKPQAGSTIQVVYTKEIPFFNIDDVIAAPVRYAAALVPALARVLALNQPAELLSGIDVLYKENIKMLKQANMRAQLPLPGGMGNSEEVYIGRKMARFNSGVNY